MVQYIITPWRNRRELLNVREAFYASFDVREAIIDEQRHKAVELVSVWVQRGNCPHSVESTALLVSAMLNEAAGTSAYAVRAAYAAAFSRFVTGLIDGYQDKRHKLSMYSIAKNIGLPATFVELRHQCTHEELPSLPKLRGAAEKSLSWIWDHYWKNLEADSAPVDIDECRPVLQEYLQLQATNRPEAQEQERDYVRRLRKWKKEQLLEVLMEFNLASTMDTHILLQSLKLARAVLSSEGDGPVSELIRDEPAVEKERRSLQDIRAAIEEAKTDLEGHENGEDPLPGAKIPKSEDSEMGDGEDDGDGTGWQLWKGLWVPKPIGVV